VREVGGRVYGIGLYATNETHFDTAYTNELLPILDALTFEDGE
jgi:hypothetical protein